ncbi:hypothetical protein VMD_16430 [Vibrio mimicus VM573]|nr:hypothetical protein VMD_16430 [Vibrio mimicus VM573]
MISARTGTHNHGFAGARCRAAHAINLLVIRIRATNHSQQQGITGSTGKLRFNRQIIQTEKHTFAGSPTHVGGRNTNL